jgi:ATP-dependent Clp protease protease subunit
MSAGKSRTSEFDVSELYDYGVDVRSKTIVLPELVGTEMLWRVATGLKRIDPRPGDVVTIEMTTVGGSLYDGLGIYDRLSILRDNGVLVRILGVGYVFSMGCTILQAASPGERVLTPNTALMLHQGQETLPEGITPDDRKRLTDEYDRIGKVSGSIVADAMGLSYAAWKKRCGKDTYFTAEQAVAAGLADRILTKENHGKAKSSARRGR